MSVVAGAQISFFYASASSNALCTHTGKSIEPMVMTVLFSAAEGSQKVDVLHQVSQTFDGHCHQLP